MIDISVDREEDPAELRAVWSDGHGRRYVCFPRWLFVNATDDGLRVFFDEYEVPAAERAGMISKAIDLGWKSSAPNTSTGSKDENT